MSNVAALELISLKKTYNNGFEALKGIDLTVKSGDFFALLGPNGAGKSTTISIISSLITKSSGTVKICGYDIDSDNINAKRQLGIVPQEFNFNPFETVFQIVVNQAGYYGIARKQAKKQAEKYLKVLDLWHKKDTSARMLSGGMKRRLMIARALVHEPKLLILDEPTAGIDIEIRHSMWDFLRKINQEGITIILTTHYLEEAEILCRNVGIIQQGKLIENTSMKALLDGAKSETLMVNYTPIDKKPTLDSYQITINEPGTFEIKTDKNKPLNELFEKLTAQGISVNSVHNKTNRLEEFFINLVQESNE